jgi:hypothetical protein
MLYTNPASTVDTHPKDQQISTKITPSKHLSIDPQTSTRYSQNRGFINNTLTEITATEHHTSTHWPEPHTADQEHETEINHHNNFPKSTNQSEPLKIIKP